VSRDKVFAYALKALARREHSDRQLRDKIARRFPEVPAPTIAEAMNDLAARRYVDDRRFAETYVAARLDLGPGRLHAELERAGVQTALIESVLEGRRWPSISDILRAKMTRMRVEPPLKAHDAARLYRALQRLGYDGEDVRSELESLL
jgi:regulatory protein